MVREFYADDLTFAAGVQGLMDWYAVEGAALVEATSDSHAYTIADLTPEDVALLPQSADLIVDPETGETIPRDVTDSGGIVSLADMACPWTRSEELLLQPDQAGVFPADWEAYVRHYDTSYEAFRAASVGGAGYDAIDAAIDPFASGFDASATERSLLRTHNDADPAKAFAGLANIGEFNLFLDARHGVFEIDGAPTGVMAILSWIDEAAWGDQSSNALLQSYSVEVNVERPDGHTLRMMAVWAYPFSKVLKDLDPESDLAIAGAVQKSRLSSDRLKTLCEEAPTE